MGLLGWPRSRLTGVPVRGGEEDDPGGLCRGTAMCEVSISSPSRSAQGTDLVLGSASS